MKNEHLKVKISGIFQLIRFELPLFAGVCVILGELLALGKFPGLKSMILGFLSVFFISAGAMVLNDYFDIDTDKINAPKRPLASGRVLPHEALILFALLSIFGFAGALLIKPSLIILVFVVWVIGILYNWRLKQSGIWGNLMVAFSVGMTFIVGGMIVSRPMEPNVVFFAAIAAFFDLGEEIIGDALDMEGDLKRGSRSLAVKMGSEKALRVGVGILMFVIFISIIPFVWGRLNLIYAIPISLMDLGILVFSMKLLRDKAEKRRKYLRYNYIFAGSMLIVFLILRLVIS
jgi:geranylgeranylglycerol-phosphate geranylgeranyltransferase